MVELLILAEICRVVGLAGVAPGRCQLEGSFAEPGLVRAGPGYRVTLAGMANSNPPGHPDLPIQEFLIGLPPEGEVELDYETGGTQTIPGQVAPVPAQFFDHPSSYELDPSVYSQDRFYPPDPVWIEEVGWLRDLRVARIKVAPVQYNPRQGLIRTHRGVSIRVRFPAIEEGPPKDDPFDRLFPRMVINYEQARGFRASADQTGNQNFFDYFSGWVKLRIDSTGVYRVKYEDLAEIGVNPDMLDPREIRIFSRGDVEPNSPCPDTMQEVPCYVYGARDGRFDPGDYILFYGLGSSWFEFDPEASQFHQNLYTRHSYYWLTWGRGPGRRMERVGSPQAAPLALRRSEQVFHLEEDRLNTGRAGLLWTWLELKPPPQGLARYEVPLQIPYAESLHSVIFRCYPLTTRNRLQVYLNNELVDGIWFSEATGPDNPDSTDAELLVERPLNPRGNIIAFEVVGTGDSAIFLDWIRCRVVQRFSLREAPLIIQLPDPGRYELRVGDVQASPLIFDIRDPYRPRVVTEFELRADSLSFQVEVEDYGLYYLTDMEKVARPSGIEPRDPGELRSPGWSAEYIIVAPDEFYGAARLLERHRVGMVPGLSVRTVRLSEIYDAYGFGFEEPRAIKSFFAAKQPIYGLFCADGSYDYKDNLELNPPPMIPPHETGRSLDPNVYSVSALANDSWYADFEGEGGTPDMILARVCARSPQEIREFLDKLKAYEGAGGGWAQRFILTADDMFKGRISEPDAGATHIQNCEAIISVVESTLLPVKVYLNEYRYLGTTPLTGRNAKPDAKADLIRELNRGALGLCYFGHGRGDLLAHEDLFNIHDVGVLKNGPRGPICFFGSCGVGRFEDTRSECISEELIRGRSGAIATVGATKGTSSGANQVFAERFYSALLDPTIRTLGEAFYTAWPKSHTYHLFGDPVLASLAPKEIGELEIEPESLKLGGMVRAHGLTKISQGQFAVTVRGPEFKRVYEWSYGTTHHQTTYRLPGVEVYQGLGRVRSDSLIFSFYLPRELPLDTIEGPVWAPGMITPLPRTTLVSAYLWGPDGSSVYRRGLIPLDTIPALSDDSTGPQIVLYGDGKPLRDTAQVPKSFTLVGRLNDPSGILIPRPPPSGALARPSKEPGLYLRDRWIPLKDHFRYHLGSDTAGDFSYPIALTDSARIKVYAYDNLSNESVKEVFLIAVPEERLAIRTPLVWPNPCRDRAYFTFELTGPAWVELRLYTISGRLIREFPERLLGSGYHQIEWDGLDRDGSPLANGVYLYRLSAHFSKELSGREKAEVVEKFLVLR